MLIERITNLQIRFKVARGTEKVSLARRAFLYIIEKYNACEFQKEKMFCEITEACPGILKSISDYEMMGSFNSFCEKNAKSGNVVSPKELNWIKKYVRDAFIRTEMEKDIYRSLLAASSHWDQLRKEFKWSISEGEKLDLAIEVLGHHSLGYKRGMELSQEFGQPYIENYKKGYFRKLLYDRHYDKAAELGVTDEDIIIGVILSNIDNRYLQDALDVARRFLPDREDIIKEIEQIIAAFH